MVPGPPRTSRCSTSTECRSSDSRGSRADKSALSLWERCAPGGWGFEIQAAVLKHSIRFAPKKQHLLDPKDGCVRRAGEGNDRQHELKPLVAIQGVRRPPSKG